MKLSTGIFLAEKVAATLQPFCERVEIAGSIRRRRAWVNDIDLVVLPKEGRLAELRARVFERTTPVTDGPQTIIATMANGVQIDLWIAQPPHADLLASTPTNFGSLLLCRTGSREHNIYLVEHAKKLGLRWNPYQGVFDGAGKCLASATEEEVFQALQLDYIPPYHR